MPWVASSDGLASITGDLVKGGEERQLTVSIARESENTFLSCMDNESVSANSGVLLLAGHMLTFSVGDEEEQTLNKTDSRGRSQGYLRTSFSAGTSYRLSAAHVELRDINGDELVDLVAQNPEREQMTVALNLGYRFTAPVPWQRDGFSKGSFDAGELNNALGEVLGFFSDAAGVEAVRLEDTGAQSVGVGASAGGGHTTFITGTMRWATSRPSPRSGSPPSVDDSLPARGGSFPRHRTTLIPARRQRYDGCIPMSAPPRPHDRRPELAGRSIRAARGERGLPKKGPVHVRRSEG
ncbi:hypothetical protein WME98_11405 [Sorangium sp. So ce296]|uniref:hypothetical protein n=1 Tax=Sorangium sp. So ce296 TaxID=3133296 RepID=UPI003F60333F